MKVDPHSYYELVSLKHQMIMKGHPCNVVLEKHREKKRSILCSPKYGPGLKFLCSEQNENTLVFET